MSGDKEKINEYRDTIQEAKGKIRELSGRKSVLQDRLKNDYKLPSIKKAESYLDEREEKKRELDEKLASIMDRIQEEMKKWE